MKHSLILAAVGILALLICQHQHLTALAGPTGAVYTRWGHKYCPRQAKLVYSGYAGGSYYDHYGGAAEYLCLPRNPVLVPNPGKSYGRVYGTEYEIFGPKHNPLDQQDVPCAVCQSKSHLHQIMLPARNICPYGWHREYYGWLMSGHHNEKGPSQYICVDHATKTVHGGHKNENGKAITPVVSICGSLKCPPYKNHYKLTCAVCTR